MTNRDGWDNAFTSAIASSNGSISAGGDSSALVEFAASAPTEGAFEFELAQGYTFDVSNLRISIVQVTPAAFLAASQKTWKFFAYSVVAEGSTPGVGAAVNYPAPHEYGTTTATKTATTTTQTTTPKTTTPTKTAGTPKGVRCNPGGGGTGRAYVQHQHCRMA